MKLGVLGAGLLAFAALGAQPAAAASPAALECAFLGTPDATIRQIEGMVSTPGGPQRDQAEIDAYRQAVDACATRHGASQEDVGQMLTYGYSKWSRTLALRRLLSTDMPVWIIEDIMDVGAGRANPPIQGMSTQQAEIMLGRFADVGFDAEAVPQPIWNTVGVYIASTSAMYRSMD
ncbi:MAG: hypothetical protein CL808_08610 [Citromicrobium sp.]|mgnify:CR=1 FL=1|nr:hypothetical protein [Citromicrobium sp.]